MFMRMPLRAYRHDAGWMLGHPFVEFTDVGRTTATARRGRDGAALRRGDARDRHLRWAGPRRTGTATCAPAERRRCTLGRDSFTPEHRFLTEGEVFDVTVQFRREHRHRMRLITMILGWGDLARTRWSASSSGLTPSSCSGPVHVRIQRRASRFRSRLARKWRRHREGALWTRHQRAIGLARRAVVRLAWRQRPKLPSQAMEGWDGRLGSEPPRRPPRRRGAPVTLVPSGEVRRPVPAGGAVLLTVKDVRLRA